LTSGVFRGALSTTIDSSEEIISSAEKKSEKKVITLCRL